jgi:hypothetical protein
MIKEGDKVICIDDSPYVLINEPIHLTKYKQYIVTSIGYGSITVMNDISLVKYAYKLNRFMLYEEWLALNREEQIKSILDD